MMILSNLSLSCNCDTLIYSRNCLPPVYYPLILAQITLWLQPCEADERVERIFYASYYKTSAGLSTFLVLIILQCNHATLARFATFSHSLPLARVINLFCELDKILSEKNYWNFLLLIVRRKVGECQSMFRPSLHFTDCARQIISMNFHFQDCKPPLHYRS